MSTCVEKMSDYKPISCEVYARYEAWILRGQRLRLVWRDDAGVTHLETAQPMDLQTKSHAEYLVVQHSDGQRSALRLDRIIRAEQV